MSAQMLFGIYGEEKRWPHFALNIFVLCDSSPEHVYILDIITKKNKKAYLSCGSQSSTSL